MLAAARLLGVALMAQAGASAAAQGLPPATPTDIASGVRSCLAATGPKTIDTDKLQADGWHSASVSQEGKPVATSLRIFGKDKVLVTIDKDAKVPTCFVTAHLPDADTFNDVAFSIDHDLGVHGKTDQGEADTFYFFPQGHIVQLKKTGTAAAPSVRIGVGYRP